MVLVFTFLKGLLESNFVGLETLELFGLLLLLLLDCLGLAAVNSQLVIGCFWLNFALKHLTLALQFALV